MKRSPPPNSRPTIADVAARAGVSIKTVSRVINNEPNVRSQTHERVAEAIKELEFRPSPSASSLAGRRSHLIGLVYSNPSWSYLLNTQAGALQRMQQSGYRLLFHPCDYRNPNLSGEILALVQQMQMEGLILTPPVSELEPLVRGLRSSNVRLVRIAPRRDPQDSLTVFADDYGAARKLTDYLIGLGHRRIGFVTGHPDHSASEQRLEGYQQSLAQAGIQIDAALIAPGLFSFESGKAAGLTLLRQSPRPSAIIASNDDMAAGVIAVAHGIGLRLPEQLSVCGFDDSPLARYLWPQLTTMRQPIFEMAYEAADMLLRSIEGGGVKSAPRADLHFQLMKRMSAVRPPAGAAG